MLEKHEGIFNKCWQRQIQYPIAPRIDRILVDYILHLMFLTFLVAGDKGDICVKMNY